jgi:hypothetical protein
MNRDHMYVTDADKALNMCGLCGVTFDEWREGKVSTFREGVMAERERIIKLLEHITQIGTECLMCGNDCSAERLIVLIKGEK